VVLVNPLARHHLLGECSHRGQHHPCLLLESTKPEGPISTTSSRSPAPCSIRVPTHFGDSTGELTTTTLKKGDRNIIKPTLDHLLEEDHKALKAYHKEVYEVFLSHYEVTRQGLVKRDATPITIRKSEVTPEVKNNPSLSLNDVQVMINSALERQAKSSNEMMRRWIEERDVKKFVAPNVNASSSSCGVNFAQTNHQPSGTSAGSTS
jgi:hypothetical protein